MDKLFANNGDPDQMPHFVPYHLGLHFLSITLLSGGGGGGRLMYKIPYHTFHKV